MNWADKVALTTMIIACIVLISVLLQALMWIPIAFIPFLFGKNNLGIWLIILFYVICFSAGKFYIPVWNSWMSDLVPKDKIGSLFFIYHFSQPLGIRMF